MQEITPDDLIQHLNSGDILYHQLYNLDSEMSQFFAIQHYLENHHDNIEKEQKLNTMLFDIEVYTNNTGKFNPEEAKHPISAFTFYTEFENTYHSYFLLNSKNKHKLTQDMIPQVISDAKTDLASDEYKYIKSEEELNWNIYLYYNELECLQNCWKHIHHLDPAIISGFYSDKFDLPYTYNRLVELLNDKIKAAWILSKFGVVKIRKMGTKGTMYQIADFPLLDIQYLYKPRGEGGLNYGSTQASYSLDSIADSELGLKKIKYNTEGMSLDTLYEEDPITYIKYNLIDVHLIKLLNDKLQHIDLHNLLRRDMKTPMTLSLRGSSALFDTFFTYELAKENKTVKWGTVQESSNSLQKNDLDAIPRPKEKSVKWDATEITEAEYNKIISRYEGAYVKDGANTIITKDEGILIDMDATALYPSMMIQYNISFDAYFGRIVDPICYNMIGTIKNILGTSAALPEGFHNTVFDLVKKYVNKLKPNNKNNYIQQLYYIIMNCFYKLKNVNIPFKDIIDPQDQKHYMLLKLYLLPLIDLWTEIHPKGEEYNTFAYNYILNGKLPDSETIYILENANETTIKISEISTKEFPEYLINNQLCLNLAGPLFYTHENHLGLVHRFLVERLGMRKTYKSKMYDFDVGSPEYTFYNRRQLTMKVNANSSYGLTGMSGFKYSNKWLAKSTTISGRLTLKISQIAGELYLRQLET